MRNKLNFILDLGLQDCCFVVILQRLSIFLLTSTYLWRKVKVMGEHLTMWANRVTNKAREIGLYEQTHG